MSAERPGVVLHVCCAPCATHCIEVLQADYTPVLFWSNANIHPQAEHDRRLAEVRRLAQIHGLDLVLGGGSHDDWIAAVRGLETEPERGRRCLCCFEYNLRFAAEYACRLSLPFTTTLTVSPHKRSGDIFAIGRRLGGFVEVDFKKRDGFRRSLELSRVHRLYRQTYCGCEFSLSPAADSAVRSAGAAPCRRGETPRV